jgi:hypothetical protein
MHAPRSIGVECNNPCWRFAMSVAERFSGGWGIRETCGVRELRPTPAGSILFIMSDVTRILSAIEQGDPNAAEQLLPLVYDELRKLAAQKLAQKKLGRRYRRPRSSTKHICGWWTTPARRSGTDFLSPVRKIARLRRIGQ